LGSRGLGVAGGRGKQDVVRFHAVYQRFCATLVSLTQSCQKALRVCQNAALRTSYRKNRGCLGQSQYIDCSIKWSLVKNSYVVGAPRRTTSSKSDQKARHSFSAVFQPQFSNPAPIRADCAGDGNVGIAIAPIPRSATDAGTTRKYLTNLVDPILAPDDAEKPDQSMVLNRLAVGHGSWW